MLWTLITYLLLSLLINVLLFIPAFLLQSDKFTDLSYSLSFIALVLFSLETNELGMVHYIVGGMVILWAVRLAGFLLIRVRRKGKDRRFDEFRSAPVSFLKFWILQAFTAWILLLPFLIFVEQGYQEIYLAGIIIWALGWMIEIVADYQKSVFSRSPENKGMFISSGLWKYSRHPNYLGEILVWFGLLVTVLPSLILIERMVSLMSPVFITMMLVYLTGVPPLEKSAEEKWGHLKRYQKYVEETPILMSWRVFKKKV